MAKEINISGYILKIEEILFHHGLDEGYKKMYKIKIFGLSKWKIVGRAGFREGIRNFRSLV